MAGTMIARGVAVVAGILLVAAGIAVAAMGFAIFAFSLIAGGVIVVIGAVFEVMRYRSESAEATRAKPGPGGGEPGRPEARFSRTDEVFVDPTTQQKMRVYSDY